MNTLAIRVSLILGLACFSAAGAQDPFGTDTPGDPFASGAAMDASMDVSQDPAAPLGRQAATAPSASDPDPLVRMLQANPAKNPREFAERLEWMTRIRRWDEVGRYLEQIKAGRWSTEQQAELSLAGGAALWYKLRDATSELTEDQREYVRQISAIPAKLARDPAWIDSWINRLAGADAAQRKQAHVRLSRAGRAAVERLALHLMSDKSRVQGQHLVEALLNFDQDGIDAIRAASMTPDHQIRSRVLLAIAQSPATEFSAELGTALHSSQLVTASAQRAISEAIGKRYQHLPELDAVRRYVLGKFTKQLDRYQLARSRPARTPVWVWRVNKSGKSVSAAEAPAPDQALEELAQLAMLRAALSGASLTDWVDSGTALAQRAYQANTLLPLASLSEGQAAAQEPAFWKQVLERSTQWQMHGASIMAAEQLGRELSGAAPTEPVFDFIASCLRDSRPTMRYIGLRAIAKADVRASYNGSANALETAIEMSRLGQGPTVLVVGLTGELRGSAEQQLMAVGAQAISAGSTADALRILSEPYPIELIMIVDRLPRNSLLTCVERLRHSKRGSALPIAVLTDQLDSTERNELARIPGVVFSILSEAPDQMRRTVAEMERRLDTRPLTPEQRLEFAETANALLSKIASDRQQYGYYTLARWESELADASSQMPLSTYVVVLGGLGSAASQQQLVSMAGDRGIESSLRSAAAEALERSIADHGLLLSRQAIERAYSLYNSQGPSDPVTVSAVGKVLDAIETRSGKGS